MTIGPENFGSGAGKNDDRFATQLGPYRSGGRREAGRAIAGDVAGADLGPRNGSGASEIRNGAGVLDAAAPIASSIPAPKLPEPARRDSASLAEAGLASESWYDLPAGSLADHPLLRGLLMELPPKGAVPPAEYLDRWFEAARSILDLLYAINARH